MMNRKSKKQVQSRELALTQLAHVVGGTLMQDLRDQIRLDELKDAINS